MSFPIRKNVLKMRPYSPGKPIEEVKRELGLTEVVKLASNENPLGPSPKAIEAVKKAADEMHIYPDAACFDIRQLLADKNGLSIDQVMIGNGSDDLIRCLGSAFLNGPDTELVMGSPSFVRYEASAEMADSRLVKVPLDDNWTHDVRAMASQITDKTRLVYIANPNNPTGTVISHGDIEWLVSQLPSEAVLVLDEAYYEFAAHLEDFPRSLDLLKAGKPIIILRTFSKAYGLAGIRMGYGFAAPEVVDAVNRVREPFTANALAQAAACAAFEDQDHVRRTVEMNAKGLERVTEAAKEMGCSVVPSFANFICIDLNRPAQPVAEALLHKGIIVRSGHVLGMPNHLRVSIGTEHEMTAFINAFKSCMS